MLVFKCLYVVFGTFSLLASVLQAASIANQLPFFGSTRSSLKSASAFDNQTTRIAFAPAPHSRDQFIASDNS